MNTIDRGFILRELIKRDFQSRYIGSALGAGWAIVHPFWQIVLFTFVFGVVIRIAPPAELTSSFAIFLFAGLVPWIAIQEGVQRSANAITDNAMLVQKLSFPPDLLVTSCVLGGFLQSLLAAAVLLLALLVRGELHPPTLPWLLLVIPFQVLLTLGLGLIVAALNVFLRDVSQFLGVALNAWFYITPVVYPLTYVQAGPDASPAQVRRLEIARGVIEANPLTAIVEIYRYAFMGGPGFRGVGLWVLLVGSVVILLVGRLLFARLRSGFPDAL